MRSGIAIFASATTAVALVVAAPALAEVRIGVIHSLTGSASAQGIPQNQAIDLQIPKETAGEKVTLITLDDASDPAVAAQNAVKLIEQGKVDLIIGSTTTPSSIAIAQAATAAKVPVLPGAPVSFNDPRDQWIFNTPPPPMKTVVPPVNDMSRRGIKTVGYLGFSDAWGEVTLKALTAATENAGIKIIADERYARSDTSITGLVLRLVAANPDAIFLGVSGSPGVLGNVSVKERFPGPIYNTNGVFNSSFLKLGGAGLEGIYGSIGAIAIAEDLPDSDPRKAMVKEFKEKYDARYGAGAVDAQAGFGNDAAMIAWHGIENALKAGKSKPGTPEFRQAVADGIRALKDLPGVHSIYNFSDPSWPWGVGDDATFLVQVKNRKWVLVK